MKKGHDIFIKLKDLYVVHHNLPGQRLAGHTHDEHHLFIPIRGRISVTMGATEMACPEGKMLYLPARVDHSFQSTENEGERLIVLIEDKAWKKRKLFTSPPRVLPSQQLLKELLFFVLLKPKSRALDSLTASFLEALSESLETSDNLETSGDFSRIAESITDPQVRKAAEFLEQNFRENVRMSQVARSSGASERTLTRAFARELSMSPKNYLMKLRIEEAARRLRVEKASVTDVAFDVGYGSLSAFIEAFRALKGQLPSDWARSR